MRVIIIGAGEVGYHVIGALYREGVDIVAVDTHPSVLEHLKSDFNITTLLGNATNEDVLKAAGVEGADLFLAITNYDETNIISCMLAGRLGVKKKVARVKSLDIGHSFGEALHFGIDLIINPYEVAAEHLELLLQHPQATDINLFLGEQVYLVRIPITAECPLTGTSVKNFGQQTKLPNTLIALVQRGGESFMPSADTMIRKGDHVYFFCAQEQIRALYRFLRLPDKPTRRVFINGGGHIGYSLAKRLEKTKMDVRILEISEWRCQELSQKLYQALILNADGMDSLALKAEGVDQADCFISITSSDEVNVVSAMQATELGTTRTICLVKQPEYIPILAEREVVDVAFSPRQLTARKILRYVRGQNLDSFFTFSSSDIELLELQIQPGQPCLDIPMAQLELPPGVLVGAVRRNEMIFIPRGQDSLRVGDTILLLQQRRNRKFTRALFLAETPPVPSALAEAPPAAKRQ